MGANVVRALAIVQLFLFAQPSQSPAEPVTITGGTVQVEATIHSARITFEGDGFFLRTGTEDFFTPIAQGPVTMETLVTLGGVWQPGDNRGARAVFKGVEYPELIVAPGLTYGTFVTPSVMLTELGTSVITMPFSFAGVVTAFARGNELGEPVFSVPVSGSGIARARLQTFTDPAGDGYFPIYLEGRDFHLEYIFSAPEPVPEPATLALAGGALGLAIARRQRRRQR